MTAPKVSSQFLHPFYRTSPQGIEVYITGQFQEIRIVFAEDGFVSVLEKVAITTMSAIEVDGITR
jgi:hypothetical protein